MYAGAKKLLMLLLFMKPPKVIPILRLFAWKLHLGFCSYDISTNIKDNSFSAEITLTLV